MTFLTWDNQADSEDSLSDVEIVRGNPHTGSNSYNEIKWDDSTKSDAEDLWGWEKPDAPKGRGFTIEDQMAVMRPGYIELDKKPSNWTTEEV